MLELLLLLLAVRPGRTDVWNAAADDEYEAALDLAAGLERRANELVAAVAASPLAAGRIASITAAAAAALTASQGGSRPGELMDATRAEAEAAYRAAIRLDPADPRAFYHLGHMLRAAGPARTSETIELFTTAAALDPLSPSLASSLGYGIRYTYLLLVGVCEMPGEWDVCLHANGTDGCDFPFANVSSLPGGEGGGIGVVLRDPCHCSSFARGHTV